MTERSRNIAVGLTTVAAMIGLGVMAVLFGGVPDLLEGGYVVTIEMPSAGGLTRDSRVNLAGIDVGRVTDVSLAKAPKIGVVAQAKVRDEFLIPAAARVTVAAPLLGGSPALEFDPSDLTAEQAQTYLKVDGSAVVTGAPSSMATALAKQFQSALAGPASQFEKVAANFDKLSDEWTKVGANLSQLTEPRKLEAVDNGDALANIPTLIARVDERMKEMQAVIKGIDAYVNDEDLRKSIKATAANAQEITAQASASMKKVDATIDNVNQTVTNTDKRIAELSDRYVKVADEMTTTLASLRQTVELARTGKGTVGKLLNDPAVYDNLNDTIERMGQALEEMKRMFEKWQKEGLPVKL